MDIDQPTHKWYRDISVWMNWDKERDGDRITTSGNLHSQGKELMFKANICFFNSKLSISNRKTILKKLQ